MMWIPHNISEQSIKAFEHKKSVQTENFKYREVVLSSRIGNVHTEWLQRRYKYRNGPEWTIGGPEWTFG